MTSNGFPRTRVIVPHIHPNVPEVSLWDSPALTISLKIKLNLSYRPNRLSHNVVDAGRTKQATVCLAKAAIVRSGDCVKLSAGKGCLGSLKTSSILSTLSTTTACAIRSISRNGHLPIPLIHENEGVVS